MYRDLYYLSKRGYLKISCALQDWLFMDLYFLPKRGLRLPQTWLFHDLYYLPKCSHFRTSPVYPDLLDLFHNLSRHAKIQNFIGRVLNELQPTPRSSSGVRIPKTCLKEALDAPRHGVLCILPRGVY